MILFYLLQKSNIVHLNVVSILKQFALQLCEAGTAGSFHIVNLNITDGGPAIVIT